MKAIFKYLGRYPFFLFLLPTFVVIHFEKEFHGIVHFKLIFDRILILFAVPALFFLVFYRFFRSARKTSLMVLGVLMFFYYTGDLKSWIQIKFPGSLWSKYSLLLSLSAFILLLIFFILKKSKSDYRRLYTYINTFFFLLILIDGFIILFIPISSKFKIVPESEIVNTHSESFTKPDIYYLLTDGYTSSENLLSEYGFSNKVFEEDLKRKGFIIIPNSHSNYDYTAYSLASVFNMNYIENADTTNKVDDREYLEAVKLLLKNKVFSFFEKEGYAIFNHSIFDINGYRTTIRDIDFWGLRVIFDQYNLGLKMLHDMGYLISPEVDNIILYDRYYVNTPQSRQRFSQTRDMDLSETIKLESNQPKFVYAHFLRTHPPYFFDSTGKFLKKENISKNEAYMHQIVSLNSLLKKTTDSIMFYARRPTAIIIQGDHGISFSEPVKQQDLFKNFNAIYFSNKDYSLFSDSTHNVNTFRIVLNSFFKKNMELLPYRSYFLKW